MTTRKHERDEWAQYMEPPTLPDEHPEDFEDRPSPDTEPEGTRYVGVPMGEAKLELRCGQCPREATFKNEGEAKEAGWRRYGLHLWACCRGCFEGLAFREDTR